MIADDVYSICQALKITKFSILAHSAGAIYALATALRMPQHIRGRIHLLAPWIPPSQMNVFGAQNVSPPANSLPTSQRILRALPTPMLKVANSKFMSATSSSITSSLPKKQSRNKRKSTGRETPAPSGRNTVTPGPEREYGRNSTVYPDPNETSNLEKAAKDITDPNHEAAVLAVAANDLADKERQVTYDSRLTHAIWDLATSGANPAVDLLVCLERRHTIGFRYVDITRPVMVHHGSKDTRVPVENVRWLGKTMKRCEVRVLEGEGHGLMASAVVMGNVLMDIAREWEDWSKVTGATSGGKAEAARRALRERASIGAFR
jgi:pimeloyl-ACP methyl ester carboxylesterase